MAVAITTGTFEYVLADDRELPPEEQTIFILKVLSFRERQAIGKMEFKRKKGSVVLIGDEMSVAKKALDIGLVGWKNFRNERGEHIPFTANADGARPGLPEEILDLIAPWAVEIANAITERAGVERDDAKNS